VALREIKNMQSSGELLLPRKPFERVVREIAADLSHHGTGLRFAPAALECLQSSAEGYLVELFDAAQKAAIHARHITLAKSDMAFARDHMTPVVIKHKI
jgi:histone H3/H4